MTSTNIIKPHRWQKLTIWFLLITCLIIAALTWWWFTLRIERIEAEIQLYGQ